MIEGCRAKRRTNGRRAGHPGIRLPPPPIYLLALLLALLLDRRAHVPFLPRGVARVLGWPLVGSGMALAAWFVRTMRGANTTPRTDKPLSSLVQHGPFRYSRNPGYLALTMIYAGIAVRRNALWAIVLLPLVLYVIQREVIGREERYLQRFAMILPSAFLGACCPRPEDLHRH